MAGRDDVRVRLSAEGVAEVVAALRKVGAEAKRTTDVAKSGFLNLDGALKGLTGALGALGIAIGAQQLIQFGAAAARAAEDTGDMSRAVGASVENFSTLSFVVKAAGQDIDGLQQPLIKLDRAIVDAKNGVGDAVEAFARFGVSREQLKDKDVVEVLDLMSKRFAQLKTSPEQAAAGFDFFGKRTAALTEVMDKLGTEGLDKVKARAKALGAVMSEDMVRAADKFNEQLRIVQLQLQVAAVGFLSGFLPAVTEALGGVGEATGKNADQWKEWGQVVGTVFKILALLIRATLGGIVVNFAVLYAVIDANISAIKALFGGGVATAIKDFGGSIVKAFQSKDFLGGVVEATRGVYDLLKAFVDGVNALFHGDAGALGAAAKAFGEKIKVAGKIVTDHIRGVVRDAKKVTESPIGPATSGGGGSRTIEASETLDQKFARREQRERTLVEATLKIKLASFKAEQDAEDSLFAHSLTSVTEHYAKRRQIAEAQFAAEKKALQDRLKLEQQNPDVEKSRTATIQIKTDLEVLETQHKSDVAALAVDEADARIAAVKRVIEEEVRVDELKGDEHTKRLREIDEELEAYTKALTVAGVRTEERDRRISTLRKALAADETFSRTSSAASVVEDTTRRERAEVQSRIDAGVTSQTAGQKELLDLYKQQLPLLREMADELERAAEATKDPAKIAAAKAYRQEVDNTALAIQGQEDVIRRVAVTLEDSGTQALADFFSTGIQGAKSLGEAFRNLAGSVVQAVQRMLSQMLALLVVQKLIGAAGFLGFSGGGAVKGATVAGEIGGGNFASRGGLFVRGGFAGGGAVKVGRARPFVVVEHGARSSVVRVAPGASRAEVLRLAGGGPVSRARGGMGTSVDVGKPAQSAVGRFLDVVRRRDDSRSREVLRDEVVTRDILRHESRDSAFGRDVQREREVLRRHEVVRRSIVRLASGGSVALRRSLTVSGVREAVTKLAGGGRAFPTGGRVTGPGGSVEDKVPAWLSHGEFVVRAAVVARPGILDFLTRLNRGTTVPEARGFRGVHRFSGGGLVVASGPTAAAPAAKAEVGLTVGLAPGLVAEQLESPEGQRTVVRIVRANRTAISSSIRG